MSRKRPHREIKVPRKVAVRRSATKDHVDKYAKGKVLGKTYGSHKS